MKIIRLSQTEDRQAWLELRRGKIGGSDSKGIRPLSRGTDRTPAGFWELLAGNLSIAKDGEPERDRGLRLENEALQVTSSKLNLPLDLDAGMWISDTDEGISVSPDSAEPGDKPTYAAEAKCLDSKSHLKAIVLDKRAQKGENYNPLESLNFDSHHDYRYQVIQYFIVNEDLETLYFTFYDDRIAYEHLTHYVITIKREDVDSEIEKQVEIEKDALAQVRALIKELINE